MFKKHCIRILIVVISFFGIASQKQSEAPNQEIIIHFADANVAVDDVENIINTIKIQLQELGVNYVNVSETGLDELKITYYSDSDISSIKDKLTDKGNLKLDLNKKGSDSSDRFPSNQDSLNYNLDFFEIQDSNFNLGLSGINVSTTDLKNDHLYYTNTNLFNNTFIFENTNSVNQKTYKALENIAFAINNIPHTIPEVRAGPYS